MLADITKVQSKIVGALENAAATLFGASMPLQRSRRRTFQFQNIPVRITYHPGFVLRFGARVPRFGGQRSET